MGRKSKSKGQSKLQTHEMEVEDKTIDLRRFAYDFLVYSANKFGLPEECIPACKIEENDYPHSNFITVHSRMLFRFQITYRYSWYKKFQKHFERTRFKSFSDIKRALVDVFRSETLKEFDEILLRRQAYLSIISELVLFLFASNCNLYFDELPVFWTEYVHFDSKLFLKHGGLAKIYHQFNIYENSKVDVFFNNFIPKYCIPYKESSTLCQTLSDEEDKFLDEVASIRLQVASNAQTINMNNLIKKVRISERARASGDSSLANPGLGIPPHEYWLQSSINTGTSLQNHPPSPTSSGTASQRRSSNQKKRLRRKTRSCASEKDTGQLSTGLLDSNAALCPQNIPSTSRREKTRDYKESIEGYQKKPSLISSGEDIERLNSGPLDANAALCPQNLPSTSRREKTRDYKESIEGYQKKPSLISSGEDIERSSSGLLDTNAALCPQNLPSTSRREKTRDYKESINWDQQMDASLLSSREDIKKRISSFFRSCSAEYHSGTSTKETLEDGKTSSNRNKTEKKKSSSCPSEDLQQLNIGGVSFAPISTQFFTGTSRQETIRDRIKTSEENKQKKKPSSDSRVEEELEQLSLGCSKTNPSDEKDQEK